MPPFPVILREQADRDVAAAIAYYGADAGRDVALAFIDALQATITVIGERPLTGSGRWGELTNLPGLRSMRIAKYPWIIFYAPLEREVEVWRVLHAKRDIPVSLGDYEA